MDDTQEINRKAAEVIAKLVHAKPEDVHFETEDGALNIIVKNNPFEHSGNNRVRSALFMLLDGMESDVFSSRANSSTAIAHIYGVTVEDIAAIDPVRLEEVASDPVQATRRLPRDSGKSGGR